MRQGTEASGDSRGGESSGTELEEIPAGGHGA
jgi:hypothetical protein